MDHARTIDNALRATLTQPWTSFTEWPTGSFVIQRCSAEPESVWAESPAEVAELAGLCPHGVLEIFDRIEAGDVLRVSVREGIVDLAIVRTVWDEEPKVLGLTRSVSASDLKYAPPLGLAFLDLMREFTATTEGSERAVRR